MTTRLPANLRDVRGLRTDDGRIVRRGVLYRSEVPLSGRADGTDVAVWPPADVIDLRAAGEHPGPHALAAPGTTVHAVPMGAALAPAPVAASDVDLSDAYRPLARDAATAIAGIAAIVARSTGPVLVQCTAGKDRTGIVVAVLLRAVGVRRADVVADYLRTGANLPRVWALLRGARIPEPRNRALMGAQAAALASVLDDVEAARPGHRTAGRRAGWPRTAWTPRRWTGRPSACSARWTSPPGSAGRITGHEPVDPVGRGPHAARRGQVGVAAYAAAFTGVTCPVWRGTLVAAGRTDPVTSSPPGPGQPGHGTVRPGVPAVLAAPHARPGVVQTLVTGNIAAVGVGKVSAFGLQGCAPPWPPGRWGRGGEGRRPAGAGAHHVLADLVDVDTVVPLLAGRLLPAAVGQPGSAQGVGHRAVAEPAAAARRPAA